jgi:MFS transporter, ACS family, hexuronate transporter
MRTTANPFARWRWVVIGVISMSSALNFLDRQLLGAAAPAIKAEFQLSNQQYGEILGIFSLAYAFATPLFGLLIDRLGLTMGVSISVILWSLASSATGAVRSLTGLLLCRAVLGVGESGSIPSVSKASAAYLPPAELGFATGIGSIAVTLGTTAAPLLLATVGAEFGWRSVFLLSGILGIPWVLIWIFVARRRFDRNDDVTPSLTASFGLLRDRRLWGIGAAYALVMAQYTLWLNWTTLYFVQDRHLSMTEANLYFAWIPPLFATMGGFAGAGLAYRWIRDGLPVTNARMRVYLTALPFLAAACSLPWLPTAQLAAVAIGLSLFACMEIVTAVHVLPIDLFGPRHAGFSVSLLACLYALTQAFLSPFIGRIVDQFGFVVVSTTMPVLPLIGFVLLRSVLKSSSVRVVRAATA